MSLPLPPLVFFSGLRPLEREAVRDRLVSLFLPLGLREGLLCAARESSRDRLVVSERMVAEEGEADLGRLRACLPPSSRLTELFSRRGTLGGPFASHPCLTFAASMPHSMARGPHCHSPSPHGSFGMMKMWRHHILGPFFLTLFHPPPGQWRQYHVPRVLVVTVAMVFTGVDP